MRAAQSPEVRERFEEVCHFTEAIGDDDEQAPPVQLRDEIVENLAEFRLIARLPALQLVDEHLQVAHARTWRDVAPNHVVKGDQPHTL